MLTRDNNGVSVIAPPVVDKAITPQAAYLKKSLTVQPQVANATKPRTTLRDTINGIDGNDLHNANRYISPFLDNMYNNQLINNAPQVPNPTLNKVMSLDTTYNVDPELNAMDASIHNYGLGIDRSTTNSNVANARKLAALSQGIKAKSGIYSQKYKTEGMLKNRNTMYMQSQDAINNAKLNKFATDKMNRNIALDKQRSANASEAVGNLQKFTSDKDLRDYQDKQIQLNQSTTKGNVWVDNLSTANSPYKRSLINDIPHAQKLYDNMRITEPNRAKILYDKMKEWGHPLTK